MILALKNKLSLCLSLILIKYHEMRAMNLLFPHFSDLVNEVDGQLVLLLTTYCKIRLEVVSN